MARDRKKRQKAQARKATKRKKAQARARSLFPPALSAQRMLESASGWPLYECLIPTGWRDTTQILQIIVARRAPDGRIAAGIFLVDLACLGVKDGYGRLFHSSSDYREHRKRAMAAQPMESCDLNLAAKVIHTAIEYARRLGFEPHRDAVAAFPILAGADPAACAEEIPTGGPEGKPFYIQGPHDNVQHILATLNRTVGRDGYHYLMVLGEPPFE
jgi:hypothetical protein